MNLQYGLLYIVATACVAGDADFNGLVPQNIIGGIAANVGEFPYMVALCVNGEHFCGGAILDARHVLTAAHCVDEFSSPYNALTVVTGTTKLHDGPINHIKSITLHYRYNISQNERPYDIAIIVVKKNITFNANQTSVALQDGPIPHGATVTMSGWGMTSSVIEQYSPYLKKFYTRILSHEECLAAAEDEDKDAVYKDIHICAGNPIGIGICLGDSGGPLVYDGRLVGIASFELTATLHENEPEYESCAQGYPAVYINVSYIVPWIQETIAETYRSEGPSDALEVYRSHFQNVLMAALALENASPLDEVNP